jgi:flagellar biogenesis protein FliO
VTYLAQSTPTPRYQDIEHDLRNADNLIGLIIILGIVVVVLLIAWRIHREQRRQTRALDRLVVLKEHELRQKNRQQQDWPGIKE